MSQAPYGPTPATPPPWPPQAAPARRGASQLLAILGLVLGLLGLGIGTAAWFRAAPTPAATPNYSDQQVAEAKKAMCGEFSAGQDMLLIVGNKRPPSAEESFVFTINSRVAIDAAMDDLRAALLEHPATPEPLKERIKGLVQNYQQLLFETLSDKTSSDIDPILRRVDSSVLTVREACK